MTEVAAIDCGTHALRLLIAGRDDGGAPAGCALEGGALEGGVVRDGAVRDVLRRMEIVRLGAGVDRTGVLSERAIERARVVLAEYAQCIRDRGIDRVRMVATSASRDARNAQDFTAMVRATLGVEPDVISGDEEARLSFAGAVAGLPADLPGPFLVVDIGGGSTEFVVGERSGCPNAGPWSALSVDIGCVRMTERHLHADPPTPRQIESAATEIDQLVSHALEAVSAHRAKTLIGLAGTATTVVGLAGAIPGGLAGTPHLAVADAAGVLRAADALVAATRAERLTMPGMHPERIDVIGGGAMILRSIMVQSGLDSLVSSEHDILDGLAMSLF